MKDKKRLAAIVQKIVIFILIVTLAMLVECLVFQFPALRYKEKPMTFTALENVSTTEELVRLTDDEENAIKVERENEKMIAEYKGETYTPKEDDTLVEKDDGMYRKIKKTVAYVDFGTHYFIHKLDVRVKLTEEAGYSVKLFADGKVLDSDLYCSIEPKIQGGICNVSKRAQGLEIEILSREEIEPQTISITVSNSFKPNKMRLFFMVVLMLFVATLFMERKLLSEYPERMFAMTSLLLGLLIISGIGTNQVSFDEYVHAKSAYKLSFGTTIESTESVIQMCGNLLPYFNNPEERQLMEAYEDMNHDYSWADIGHQSRFVRAETRVYYPMALGFYIGRKLGLGFAMTVALAKFGNLLFYTAIVYFAIKKAKKYKCFVTLVGLLPNCMFLASSLTYDTSVNAFLLLGSVLILNEILEPDVKITWQNALLILLSFFIGCQSKPIYIFMVLMMVFFGKNKFENRWQEIIFKMSVIIMTGLMLYNIFRPTPAAGSDYHLVSNISFAGDKRAVGTSVTGQIEYIINNPLTYTLLLLKSMGQMLFDYLGGGSQFFRYGYMGSVSTVFTYIVLLLGLWLSIFSPKLTFRKSIGTKYKIVTIIMILGVSAVIFTSMYVTYSPVGASEIKGVQGRYFIPLFLPLAACFWNEKHESRLNRVNRSRVLYVIMIGLNMYMILTRIILKINV